jgi:hypothetical protein
MNRSTSRNESRRAGAQTTIAKISLQKTIKLAVTFHRNSLAKQNGATKHAAGQAGLFRRAASAQSADASVWQVEALALIAKALQINSHSADAYSNSSRIVAGLNHCRQWALSRHCTA